MHFSLSWRHPSDGRWIILFSKNRMNLPWIFSKTKMLNIELRYYTKYTIMLICLGKLHVKLTCRSCGAPWPSLRVPWFGLERSGTRWHSWCCTHLDRNLQVLTGLYMTQALCVWQMNKAGGPTLHHLSTADIGNTWNIVRNRQQRGIPDWVQIQMKQWKISERKKLHINELFN